MEEQLSFIKIEKTLKDRINKQMKVAIKKGIIPGAVVCFDNDEKYKYIVSHLTIGNGLNLVAALKAENSHMTWRADSERLKAIGFHEMRSAYTDRLEEEEE